MRLCFNFFELQVKTIKIKQVKQVKCLILHAKIPVFWQIFLLLWIRCRLLYHKTTGNDIRPTCEAQVQASMTTGGNQTGVWTSLTRPTAEFSGRTGSGEERKRRDDALRYFIFVQLVVRLTCCFFILTPSRRTLTRPERYQRRAWMMPTAGTSSITPCLSF